MKTNQLSAFNRNFKESDIKHGLTFVTWGDRQTIWTVDEIDAVDVRLKTVDGHGVAVLRRERIPGMIERIV